MTENEWETEPNYIKFIDEETGYECLILRNEHLGTLCGYVKIKEDHPLFGLDYNSPIPPSLEKACEKVMEGTIGKRGSMDVFLAAFSEDAKKLSLLFDVHGSVSFSGELRDQEGFWFGFDCGHAGDIVPMIPILMDSGEYRNVKYVEDGCRSLARQIKEFSESLKI